MSLQLLEGDVILGRPSGWLGSTVVWFEGLFGDPAEFAHVGIVTKGGDEDTALVTEALAHVETKLFKENWGGRDFAIYRLAGLSCDKRAAIAKRALEYTGRDYGWWKLLLIATDAWISHKRKADTRVFSRLISREQEPICSFLVQEVFIAESVTDFGVPKGTAQPDDIGDYAWKRPEWVLVGGTDLPKPAAQAA